MHSKLHHQGKAYLTKSRGFDSLPIQFETPAATAATQEYDAMLFEWIWKHRKSVDEQMLEIMERMAVATELQAVGAERQAAAVEKSHAASAASSLAAAQKFEVERKLLEDELDRRKSRKGQWGVMPRDVDTTGGE